MAIVAVMSLISCATDKASAPGHYEIVTFQLVAGTQPEAFISVNKEVENFLSAQPGFLNRSIGKVNDSVWIDVLSWRLKSDFEKAFEKSASDEAIIEMSKMINEATYNFFSFEPSLSH